MTDELLEILKKELASLAKSTQLLQGSYDRCLLIWNKPAYSSSSS